MRSEEVTVSVRSLFSSLSIRLTPYSSLLTVFLLLSSGCSEPKTRSLQFNGPTMGSTWSVQIPFAPDNLPPAEIEWAIVAILDDINHKMSTYIKDSELSLINASPSTEWIEVSSELYDVLAASDRISRETDGAFDITVGPLVNLWGFGPDKKPEQIPADELINARKKHTGNHLIELRPSPAAIRKLDPEVYLDLSGIAPGYAADRVASRLEELAITDYLVDITGEVRARGVNDRHESWRVGIEKPLLDRRTVQHIVKLENTGLTTAGDYRNFFMYEGRRYSHTIDPATGRPVAHNLTLVTVIHPSATLADALDTALMVMGPERALAYANRNKIAALFILNRDNVLTEMYSDSFAPYLIK